MVKTRSMTRNQNDDDDDASSSSSRKKFKTFDNNCVAPWSYLNDDTVNLVMTQLGVIDFLAFSGVCKSWRSVAHSKRNWFMASRPPMSMSIEPRANNQDSYIYLKDLEGRMFRTILPNSCGRTCFGLTCGYLILFSRETRDFWLVNPITRHELHFPDYPFVVDFMEMRVKAILVFSPLVSRFVLVVLHRTKPSYTMGKGHVSFSIAGKRGWNCVSSTLHVLDLHAFKGKIYIIHTHCSLGELRLHPKRKHKWTLLDTKISAPDIVRPELVSSGENLYLISITSAPEKVLQLDFDEMKWVLPEKTIGEYAFFYSLLKFSAPIVSKLWAGTRAQYKSYDCFLNTDKSQKSMFNYNRMWYYPHDCLNVNQLDK